VRNNLEEKKTHKGVLEEKTTKLTNNERYFSPPKVFETTCKAKLASPPMHKEEEIIPSWSLTCMR
jgi:hypothetical protein